ncbi:glycosyltransferase [Fibrella arboris]|uniref:glycosyltransferase n=1 Tax=Fibrella arboris TaxID=3242486 RepID=UPI00351FB356
MRILNICAYTWAIGGPARIIYDHAGVAVQRGHQVDILSPMSPGDDLYPAPAGVRVIPVLRTPPISRVFREYSAPLYQFLKAHIHEYDIVHCHGIWHFGSLAPFLLDKSVTKVVTIHGLLDKWAIRHSYWKKKLLTIVLQKRILNQANLIQINNTDEQGDLLRYLGHQHPNVVIIPNGIPMADFEVLPLPGTFRKQHGIPAKQPLILFMSRLNIKKGLDLLLPAFRQYAERHPDALLVLAGPDDGYQAATEAFVRDNNLTGRVKLVGMLIDDAKKAALADADVFVLPSYSEGFSMAVLEAMASGTPTIVSDRVGFGEVIRETGAACLTDLSAEGVLACLEKVLHNDDYREQIRTTGQALVRERYDIQVVADQLLAAYQATMKQRRVTSTVVV